MTDNDNILISKFLQESAQQQIADDGFTDKVMQRISQQTTPSAVTTVRMMSHLWTCFCILVGAGLFFAFDGPAMLKSVLSVIGMAVMTNLEVFLTTAPTMDLQLNPLVLVLALVFVLVFLPYQTYRKLSSAL